MENEFFSRTEMLIGKENIEKLKNSKVAIFGIGGVGSYVLEGLVRAGIGNLLLVDNDEVSISNINRQIIATHKTVGESKVEVAKQRALEINPQVNIEIYKEFFTADSKDLFDGKFDYVIDAIDTVSSKLELVERANKYKVPIISCMGTGNKLYPTKFEITDINKTSVCPLAKVMRKELRARGIKKLKVLYSREEPIKINNNQEENNENRKKSPGSISFVPSVAGLIIAGEVIKDIIKNK